MVTNEGYVRRTYEEILNAKIAKAQELFGADINTDGNTALGKFIRINAYDQYNVESIAEKIYYSIFPQTASGQSLDRLGWTVGITRKAATHSVYEVRVVGTVGAIVKIGFAVGTEAGLTFHNLYETTIGAEGYGTLTVECDEAGAIGNVSASDITKIVNPVADISEIDASENILKTAGEGEESDYDFLKRYEIVREGKGGCNESALLSALLSVEDVKEAYIVTDEAIMSELGIPSNYIACFVHGGESSHAEIAKAIFDKKPVGIGTFGEETATVSYGALNEYEIHFSHAETVPIYVNLELETDATFEGQTAMEEIKANVSSFIQDMGIGKSLIVTAMYKAIYSVTGVVSAQLTVSTDNASWISTSIEIKPYQICSFKQLAINNEIV